MWTVRIPSHRPLVKIRSMPLSWARRKRVLIVTDSAVLQLGLATPHLLTKSS